MTKVEALKKCRDMWQWLAENPRKFKRQYSIQGTRPMSDCFACEYTIGEKDKSCEDCILLRLWTRKKRFDNACPCHWGEKSPYAKWELTSNRKLELRTKYAQQIADFCKSELKRMKK